MRVSRWLDDKEPAPSAADVARLLNEIGLAGDEFHRIVQLAEDTGDDWLVSGPAGINPQLAAVLACERDAIRITECAPTVFPGLLQIRDYARSIIAGGAGLDQEEIETRLTWRIARGDALTRRTGAVDFTAFIGLPAIHANIGGQQVMADQLAHVADLSRRHDNVNIQAVDLSDGWTPMHAGAFVIYEFESMPAAVYLEHYRSGALVVEEDDVTAYQTAAEDIRRVAMSPADTLGLIAKRYPA